MLEHETRKRTFEHFGRPNSGFDMNFSLASFVPCRLGVGDDAVTDDDWLEETSFRSAQYDVGVVDGKHRGVVRKSEHVPTVHEPAIVDSHRGVRR